MNKYIILLISIFGITYSQCDLFSEIDCNNNDYCEWIENINSGWCGSYNNNSSACNNIDDCNWSTCQVPCTGGAPSDCTQAGCSYSWLEYTCTGYYSAPCCSGGSYQEDNSYCQEIEVIECVEMNQLQCNHDFTCDWVENIEYGDCSDYSSGTACDANENCFWDLCYGGSYGSWSHCCRGGNYQIINSYCEEIEFILGDVNGDGSLNVSDIIIIVELILNSNFNMYSDLNQDGILNVLDVIELVNVILNS